MRPPTSAEVELAGLGALHEGAPLGGRVEQDRSVGLLAVAQGNAPVGQDGRLHALAATFRVAALAPGQARWIDPVDHAIASDHVIAFVRAAIIATDSRWLSAMRLMRRSACANGSASSA